MREQNDPSGLPQPPPPCGPGVPGKPSAPKRPQDIGENRPNTGVPVPEERTRDDPAEQVPARPTRRWRS